MGGHTNWSKLKASALSRKDRSQLAVYTKGYMLALQDILKDIDNLDCYEGDDASYGDGYSSGLQSVQSAIELSIWQAQETLDHLT